MEPKEAERLMAYATKDIEIRALEAVIKAENMAHAAIIYGRSQRAHQQQLYNVKTRAAYSGDAPGHIENGAAPGFQIKKTTIQRDSQGNVERTWERQTAQDVLNQDLIEAIDATAEAFKAKSLPKIKCPRKTNKDLLTLYTITDFHLGMYAWAEECGDDWDTKIAETVLKNAVDDMVSGSPESEVAILNNLGDFMHWDGLDAVTPMSKHPLDADSRFDKLVELSVQMMQYCVQRLLEKHKKVKMIMCEGNHDMASSVWLRKCMKYMFIANPRVEVDDTSFPFYAHLHGEIMLGFHHGHKVKNKDLAKLFSSEPRYREMWGKAKYTFIHSGHFHHTDQDEGGGAIVERHPTLAARDSYASRGGWVSWRAAKAITYHTSTGEYSRKVVHPDYSKR